MNRLVLLLSIMFCTNLYAGVKNTEIEHYIKKNLPNMNVGIMVLDAETGKTIYQRQAIEAFPPASTTKLLTAASGLMALGPDHRYETSIKINKQNLNQGVLQDNLYIHFSGDPSLTKEDLKSLLKSIKDNGIQKITGNIVLNTAQFQGPVYGLGWSNDSLPWYFSAPVSSVILNENRAKLILNSNQSLNGKATVSLDPEETTKIKINDNIISVTEEEAETKCQINVTVDEKNDVTMIGCWPKNEKPVNLKTAIVNPILLAKQVILEALATENIQLSGQIVEGSKVDSKDANGADIFQVIVKHQSEPLQELIKPILQDSNNLYAESLFKTLGVAKFQEGSFKAGVRAVKDILTMDGKMELTNVRLFDGSGNSRYNMITPKLLANVLFTMNKHVNLNVFFKQALPVAGESGTLKKRMENIKDKAEVRAKTGSLLGVSTIAGYIKPINQANTQSNKKELIFVIMIDHIADDKFPATKFQDGLVELFI